MRAKVKSKEGKPRNKRKTISNRGNNSVTKRELRLKRQNTCKAKEAILKIFVTLQEPIQLGH